jgi:hypothetical protein
VPGGAPIFARLHLVGVHVAFLAHVLGILTKQRYLVSTHSRPTCSAFKRFACANRKDHDPETSERLKNLACPSIGHWWEFIRRLVPPLADAKPKPPPNAPAAGR